MGHDGLNTSVNAYFAKDVFSFSLGYYTGDYHPIDITAPNFLSQIPTTSTIFGFREDLWNGNIGTMISNLTPATGVTPAANDISGIMGTAYFYDQLNRLIEANSLTNYNPANNEWEATSQIPFYLNRFGYDPNGNITFQGRDDHLHQKFEDLEYNYHHNATGEPLSNRLYSVDELDAVHNSVYTDDIEDQGIFDNDPDDVNTHNNYQYTEIGELKRDVAEDIDEIIWRVDSKISYISRTVNSVKKELKFEYDPMGNRIAKHVINTGTGLLEKSTYYVRDASGNVMATYEHVAEELSLAYTCIERPIYGSSRVGMDVNPVQFVSAPASSPGIRRLGEKQYELSNHLGNVLSVINDIKLPVNSSGTVVSYTTVVVSAQDYSPFGVVLKGRNWSTEEYRYGFNGKEKDDEFSVEDGSYDFGARMYDARLGRWWSVDGHATSYPAQSTYGNCFNNPIFYLDPDGNDIIDWYKLLASSNYGYSAKIAAKSTTFMAVIAKFQSQKDKTDKVLLDSRSGKYLNKSLSAVKLTFKETKEAGKDGTAAGGTKLNDYEVMTRPDGTQYIELTSLSIDIQLSTTILEEGQRVNSIIHEVALHLETLSTIIERYASEGIISDVPNFQKELSQLEFLDHTALQAGQADIWEKTCDEVDQIIATEYKAGSNPRNEVPTGCTPSITPDACQISKIFQYASVGSHPFKCNLDVNLLTDPVFNRSIWNNAEPPSEIKKGTSMTLLSNFRFHRNIQYDYYQNVSNRKD